MNGSAGQEVLESVRKSYTYVRITMVALLVGLATAVIYQSVEQGSLLQSVSAYYYSPAQAMFVGSLVALGACMIALKGTTRWEDIFLNLGGMFAAVVAIVPTSRGVDYKAALAACAEADVVPDVDCLEVNELNAVAEANIENSMIALLVLGALGLLTAAWIAARSRSGVGTGFWMGIPIAAALWVAGAVAFFGFRSTFVDQAHIVAAIGLAVCVLLVVGANAARRKGQRLLNFYTWYAALMVVVTAVMAVLMATETVTLFWLEIVVAALFIPFWAWQTFERAHAPVSASAPAS